MPAARLLIATIDVDGGAGAFVRNLTRGLARYCPGDVRTSLLMLRRRGLLDGDAELFDSIHAIDDDERARVYQPLRHAMRVNEAVDALAPDVILTVGTYANLLVPLAARGRRAVLTVHSNVTGSLVDSQVGGVMSTLIRLLYPRRVVVTPAAGVAEDLRHRFGVPDADVIPHGVDGERIRELALMPVDDLPVVGSYIVACGRLTAAKDYPTMLRAYAIARQRGFVDPLVIIGGGEDRSASQALSRDLRLSSFVHFLGHRDNPYKYMRQAKLFVLSSVFEGFGLALVEAMALGLPCVSTDCPSGPAEILERGKFGVLVPPSDPEALASALVDLRRSPERLAFFAKQSRIRAENFSLARMARSYRDLLLQR
jgi:glycosyltransferase involved in cell wall biosynthesis